MVTLQRHIVFFFVGAFFVVVVRQKVHFFCFLLVIPPLSHSSISFARCVKINDFDAFSADIPICAAKMATHFSPLTDIFVTATLELCFFHTPPHHYPSRIPTTASSVLLYIHIYLIFKVSTLLAVESVFEVNSMYIYSMYVYILYYVVHSLKVVLLLSLKMTNVIMTILRPYHDWYITSVIFIYIQGVYCIYIRRKLRRNMFYHGVFLRGAISGTNSQCSLIYSVLFYYLRK
eukprot:GEMP01065767.1.p1 GENE.GEMP01065767.1~~GEMP01065767.1.p1  ORF type:complete len:232 (+),score=-19.85 GEMP01065767.1:617-1312(+)